MSSIRLSRKHGVNPMITGCFYCGKQKNEIVLLGRLQGDKPAPPNGSVIDYEPCDQCKALMDRGIMLIGCRDESFEADMAAAEPNPYRTGNMLVMSESWVERMVNPPELAAQILEKRMAFVPDAMIQSIQRANAELEEGQDT